MWNGWADCLIELKCVPESQNLAAGVRRLVIFAKVPNQRPYSTGPRLLLLRRIRTSTETHYHWYWGHCATRRNIEFAKLKTTSLLTAWLNAPIRYPSRRQPYSSFPPTIIHHHASYYLNLKFFSNKLNFKAFIKSNLYTKWIPRGIN